MKKDFLQILIAKYQNGEATEEEQALLFSIYEHYQNDDLEWQSDKMGEQEQVKKALFFKINSRVSSSQNVTQTKKRSNFYRIAAAVVLLCLSVGGYQYLINTKDKEPQLLTAQNDILPGTDKATLTLTDGKKVSLEDNKRSLHIKETGVVITKDTNGNIIYTLSPEKSASSRREKGEGYNTIETARGGQYMVNLPDGSKVWLNSASSIRFPLQFADNQRYVTLTGEGYFEIAKDKNRPFFVKTTGQVVEVLGTHFNINAYRDETAVKTTLLEGSVRVNMIEIKNVDQAQYTKLSIPGEQSIINGNQIQVKSVDIEQAIAWKNGLFYFQGTPLKEMMKQLSRWYDVDIVYKGTVKNELFYGKIFRSYTLYDVLKVLQLGNIHFKIEEESGKKKLIVTN